jgi:NTP pyrophosphatase (non-canonical NTP hydrolase)
MINPFNLITNWRTHFGLPVRTTPQIPSKEEIKLAIDLIDEEYGELRNAIESGYPEHHKDQTPENIIKDNISINEVADAIGDLYYVVTQMANIFGLNPDELISKVYESNMSKLCKSQIEADRSIQAYKDKDIEAYYVKLSENLYIIKRLSDNKVLKSINFFEPKWEYDAKQSME